MAGMCDPSHARKAKVLYFFAAGAAMGAAAMGAAMGAAAMGALPCKKALTQVVLFKMAKCTENDATATAAIMSGTPTEGLTTNHIFP